MIQKYKTGCLSFPFYTGIIILCTLFFLPLSGLSYTSPFLFSNNRTDPKPEGNFEVLIVPLKRAGNLLLVEARIDSVEGNFILDTGAPYLVLNKTYFRNGKEADGVSAGGITGAGTQVFHTTVDRLEIQDLYYETVNADLVNLGHIEDSKGIKILGLLGASLFNQMEMEIDVKNNVLYLYRLNQSGDRLQVNADTVLKQPGLQIPIEIANNIVFLRGSVGGTKLRFCFDTGAEINVLSNMAGKKVLQKFHLKSRNTLMGSSNLKVEALGGELDELVMGDHIFLNEQAILTNIGANQSVYDLPIQGILGYNFLDEGRVIINHKKKQLTMYFYNEEKK